MNKAANSGLVHFAVGITGEAKSRSRRFAAIVGWPRAERLWPDNLHANRRQKNAAGRALKQHDSVTLFHLI